MRMTEIQFFCVLISYKFQTVLSILVFKRNRSL